MNGRQVFTKMRLNDASFNGRTVAAMIRLANIFYFLSIAFEHCNLHCSAVNVSPSFSLLDGYSAVRYDFNNVATTSKRYSVNDFFDVKLETIADIEDGSSLLFIARRNVIYCLRNPDNQRHASSLSQSDVSDTRESPRGGELRQFQLTYNTGPVNASLPIGSKQVSLCNKSRVDREHPAGPCVGTDYGTVDVVPVLLVAIPYGGLGEAMTSETARRNESIHVSSKRQLVLYCDKKLTATTFDDRRTNVTDDLRCLVFDPTTSSTNGRLRPSGQLNDRTSLVALARAVGSTDRMLYRHGDNVRALVSTSRSRDVAVATSDDNAESIPLYVASGGPRLISSILATVSSLRIKTRRRLKPGNDDRAERIDVTVAETGRMELRSRPTWSLGRFPVRYVDGGQFEHGQFIYFVTVQPETVPIAAAGNLTDPVLVTRLIRFCRNDDSEFYSYAELTLSCGVSRASAASIARAARFVRSSARQRGNDDVWNRRRRVSASDGEYDNDRLLILADGYRAALDGSNPDGKYGSGMRSVLCVYQMSELRKQFTRAVKECFGGHGRLLPWTVPNDQPCAEDKTQLKVIDDDFCGHRSNAGGINVRFPVEADSIVWTSEQHRGSSLAISEQKDKMIVWIGTFDGYVLKVPLEGGGSVLRPMATVNIGAGVEDVNTSRAVTGIVIDSAQDYIYVTTTSQVIRLAASSCSLYADCERCISSRDTLGCAWCDDRCVTSSECALGFPLHRYTETCPPSLTSFQPHSGPSAGGSMLTIHGRYLGGSSSVAVNSSAAGTLGSGGDTASVQIGTTNCTIEFRNFSTIQCRIGSVNSSLSREVKVFVSDFSRTSASVDIQGFASSGHQSFAYKDVSVTSVYPHHGPQSGGTLVTVSGTNLDVGAYLSVQFFGLPCDLISVSEAEIVCNSSQYDASLARSEQRNGSVEIAIDGVLVSTAETHRFTYTDDPIITSVHPIVTFNSGGLPLTVFGKNLNTVQRPTILVQVNGSEYTDTCTSLSHGETMICSSPNLSNADLNLPTTMTLQFKMDGADMSRYPVSVTYTDDPTLYNATCRPINDEHDVLVHITGNRLNLSTDIDHYRVLIGDHQPCNVTSLTDQEIECSLRADVIATTSQVKVFIGRLVLDLGRVNCGLGYRSLASIFSDDPRSGGATLAILTTGAVILLAMFIVLCAVSVAGLARRAHRWPFNKKRSCQMEPNVLYVTGTPSSPTIGQTGNLPSLPDGTAVSPPTRDTPPRGGGRNSYWTRSLPDRERLLAARTLCNSVLDEETRRVLEDSHLLIPRHRLLVLDSIGQGHFGCVFRGLLKFPGQKAEAEVAVKTLRSLTECLYASSVEMRKFLDEALTMTEFNHEHVLRLIGVVVDGDRMPLVVLPFMTHGDLLSYIRDENNSPSVKDLMDFGIQIANGMAYLAGLKFVHRDLAARNCMLDENMVVKVADFGLSRDIYERDYYSSDNHKAKLPVKWMALESLEKSIYNVKTDVWSYGVVLWELMTRGVCPYPEVDNWDIVRFLKSGRRMLQPSYCPTVLYKLMVRCWDVDPNRRPSFPELATSVDSIILEMRAAAEGRVGLEVAYINVIGSAEDISDDVTPAVLSVPVGDYLRPLNLPPSDRATADVLERITIADSSPMLATSVIMARQVATCEVEQSDEESTSSSDIWMRRELDQPIASDRRHRFT